MFFLQNFSNNKMRKYQHLFFDLDHTIWDFNTNESETLTDLYNKYELFKHFDSFDAFFERYKPINAGLWLQYRNGEIRKKDLSTGRFYNTFVTAGYDNLDAATAFSADFVSINATKTAVVPHTFEVLDYLHPRYKMHIITNGFIETQHVKLDKSGLRPYFDKIFISEEIGIQKPKKGFFEYAVKSCNARKKESLVIGDNLEVDIQGAKNFGLDHVYFNPSKTLHTEDVLMEITSLLELKEIL
jgi:putative hydrolase of the HAD superfamily